MNKITIFCLFICIYTSNFYGQLTDTIFLQEIKVINKPKTKVLHVKTKGITSSLTGQVIKSAISRVDNLPAGNLSSIKFYFNHSLLDIIQGNNGVDYKDTELGLLIYNVNEDGTPGEEVTDKEIRFMVSANQRGSIELDLKPLYLNTKSSMYFGFELFKEQAAKDFRIILEISKDNPKTFYIKNWKNDKMSILDFGEENLTLKMVVGVIPLK